MQPAAGSSVVAPIIRRHAADAAFYWQQLDVSLTEPGLRAQRLLHFARLLAAHLEGLTVAGPAALPAAREALAQWRKPGEAFAASYAALCAGDEGALHAVLGLIARAPDLLLRGLIGALTATPKASAQAFFERAWSLLSAGSAAHTPVEVVQLVAALRASALRGVPLDAAVRAGALNHPHPAVRAAACRACTGAPELALRLADPDLAVRAEAAIALRSDPLQAASALWQCVAAQAQACLSATGWNRLQTQRRLARWLRHLAWLAPLDHADVPALLAHLPLREALRFVLFHGNPAHLDFVRQALGDAEQGRWAGFVWQSLTGVDLVANGLTLAEPPIDLDAGLSRARQDGDQGLPLPDPNAVSKHPANAALSQLAGQRVLLGQTLCPAFLASLLRIEADQPQLLRAVAAHAWNEMGLHPRFTLRADALTLLRQDAQLDTPNESIAA